MIRAPGTPGPWSVGPAHVVAQRHTDEQGRRVTRFVAEACLSAPFVDGEREENARLMSAAPQLYEAAFDTAEALELLQIGLVGDAAVTKVLDVHLDLLRTALAKANGEQS